MEKTRAQAPPELCYERLAKLAAAVARLDRGVTDLERSLDELYERVDFLASDIRDNT